MKRNKFDKKSIQRILLQEESFFLFKESNVPYVFYTDNLKIAKIDDPALKEYFRICKHDEGNITSFLSVDDLLSIHETVKEQILDDPFKIQAIPRDKINTLILNVSGDCNLRCKYCMTFNRKPQDERPMTFLTAKAAIDQYILTNSFSERFRIVFFGGEPLLNIPAIIQIVNYCNDVTRESSQRIDFSIVTNGTILPESFISFIIDNNIFLTIGLDSSKEIHDQNRIFKNKKPTFNTVIRNMHQLRKRAVKMEICSGITSELVDLVGYFDTLEKLKTQFSYSFIQEILKNSEKNEGSFGTEEILRISEQYPKLVEYYYKKIADGDKIYCKNIIDSLKIIHHRRGKIIRCSAGKNTVTVNPDGSIYSCQFLNNVKDASIGSLDDGIDKKKRYLYSSFYINDSERCVGCRIKYICGGDCFADKYIAKYSLNIPPKFNCELSRIEWINIFHLYVKIMETNPDFFPPDFSRN